MRNKLIFIRMRKFWMRLLQVVTQRSRAVFWEKSVVWRRVISKYISIYKYSFIYLKLQAYPHSPWGIYALYRYSTWNLFLLSEWTEQKFRLLFTPTEFFLFFFMNVNSQSQFLYQVLKLNKTLFYSNPFFWIFYLLCKFNPFYFSGW